MIMSTARILSMFSVFMALLIFSSEPVDAKDESKEIVELERQVQQ